MKFRFSFSIYIANMTCASTAFLILAGFILSLIFSLPTGGGTYVIVLGMFVSIFPTIVGLISGFISSVLVSLIASIFFSPENISERKFQILSFAIVATVSLIIFGMGRSFFVDSNTISLPEVALAIITINMIMLAHNFAIRYLVTPIEKRKEK